jgi:hypothetical protein
MCGDTKMKDPVEQGLFLFMKSPHDNGVVVFAI